MINCPHWPARRNKLLNYWTITGTRGAIFWPTWRSGQLPKLLPPLETGRWSMQIRAATTRLCFSTSFVASVANFARSRKNCSLSQSAVASNEYGTLRPLIWEGKRLKFAFISWARDDLAMCDAIFKLNYFSSAQDYFSIGQEEREREGETHFHCLAHCLNSADS